MGLATLEGRWHEVRCVMRALLKLTYTAAADTRLEEWQTRFAHPARALWVEGRPGQGGTAAAGSGPLGHPARERAGNAQRGEPGAGAPGGAAASTWPAAGTQPRAAQPPDAWAAAGRSPGRPSRPTPGRPPGRSPSGPAEGPPPPPAWGSPDPSQNPAPPPPGPRAAWRQPSRAGGSWSRLLAVAIAAAYLGMKGDAPGEPIVSRPPAPGGAARGPAWPAPGGAGWWAAAAERVYTEGGARDPRGRAGGARRGRTREGRPAGGEAPEQEGRAGGRLQRPWGRRGERVGEAANPGPETTPPQQRRRGGGRRGATHSARRAGADGATVPCSPGDASMGTPPTQGRAAEARGSGDGHAGRGGRAGPRAEGAPEARAGPAPAAPVLPLTGAAAARTGGGSRGGGGQRGRSTSSPTGPRPPPAPRAMSA